MLAAVAIAASAIGAAAAGSAPAAAGDNDTGTVEITIGVEGADAVDVLNGLTIEFVRPDSSVFTPTCTTDFGPAGVGGSNAGRDMAGDVRRRAI